MSCKTKRASFGYPNTKQKLYCASCKLIGMVDNVHKKCIVCKIKEASFGYPNTKQKLYCASCKLIGMVDNIHKKCIVCKTKTATFGLPNTKKADYCAKCKLDGMVDIRSRKCVACNIKQPAYGLPTDKRATYCVSCKLENMVDIRSAKCIACNNKQPCFAFPSEPKARYCADCKEEGMVDVKHPKCVCCDNNRAYYGMPDDKTPTYCVFCKTKEMMNLVALKCKSEWCYTLCSRKYEGYCSYCFIHLFPEKPITRNYKTKEKAVVEYIQQQFANIDIIIDRKIQDGCSRRRPDVFIDLGYQIIIIEIDENQHIDYDCSCENKRIMQLSQDVGHRPIIFIRFNPDEYTINEKKITSCWKVNKLGICYIKQNKEKEWNARLQALEESIDYWMKPENRTDKIVEVIQLFYDTL